VILLAGIDAGQSSTVAVIGDEKGRVLGRASGPAADLVGRAIDSPRQVEVLDGTLRDALKAAGLDFVCISSGGISADTRPTLVANTNVQFAEKVKREAGIATRTVGLIAAPKQAEAIIAEGKADMVALARAMLDDPHWGWRAAHVLGADVARPKQYQRAAPKVWAGAAFRD